MDRSGSKDLEKKSVPGSDGASAIVPVQHDQKDKAASKAKPKGKAKAKAKQTQATQKKPQSAMRKSQSAAKKPQPTVQKHRPGVKQQNTTLPHPPPKRKPASASNEELSTSEKIALLNDKVARFRSGEIKEHDFTSHDKHALWARCHQHKAKSHQAMQQWEDIKPHGPGSDHRKNTYLWSWVRDPTWGKHFLSRVQSVTVNKVESSKSSWLSYQQLVDKHGKEEANGLILDKAVMIRSHPRSPRFFQFLDTEDFYELTTTKQQKVEAEQKACLKNKQFIKFYKCLSNTDHEQMHQLEDPDFGSSICDSLIGVCDLLAVLLVSYSVDALVGGCGLLVVRLVFLTAREHLSSICWWLWFVCCHTCFYFTMWATSTPQ